MTDDHFYSGIASVDKVIITTPYNKTYHFKGVLHEKKYRLHRQNITDHHRIGHYRFRPDLSVMVGIDWSNTIGDCCSQVVSALCLAGYQHLQNQVPSQQTRKNGITSF